MNQKANQSKTVPIRPALQKRSLKTQQKILKVVEKLLQEGKFEQATVQDIVRQSRCSIGAFYGRFKDKNAALFSFYDAHCVQLESSTLVILDPTRSNEESLAQILSEFVETTVRHTLAHAEILKADTIKFSDEEGDPFLDRARKMNRQLHQALAAVLLARRDEFDHPDVRLGSMFVLGIVGGLTRDAITTGQKLMKTGVSAEVLQRELSRTVLGYLGITVKQD